MRVPPEYADSIQQAAPPVWVVDSPVDFEAVPPPEERASGGIWNLLSDTQHNLQEKVRHEKIIFKLSTEGGVQNGSRLQINFSPHLNRIVFHTLTIYRNFEPIDLLAEQEIQVLQREERMEGGIFSGALTAVLLLRDTRVGDIIDYSFSIQSLNVAAFNYGYGAFLLKYRYTSKIAKWRLLYPAERPVYSVSFNHDIAPEVTQLENGLVDCRWEVLDQTPVPLEPDTPRWYLPWSLVEYGEFSSWNEVAQWLCHVFYAPSESPPEFHDLINNIASRNDTFAGRVQEAARFVQDEIRYVSVSVGEHGYKPYDAATVLARRYGDCKDKALLLSNLLRGMGIDALPALVDTLSCREVARHLPSPAAFDHAIVKIRHEDEVYWIDATIRGQRGSLDKIFCPDYGKALVISPETTDLEDIHPRGVRSATTRIIETFKIHQLHVPAELSVTEIYEGANADGMRNSIADSSHEQFERNRLNRYRGYYPKIETVKPWRFQDDPISNRLEVFFDYRVSDLWREVRRPAHHSLAYFYATGINRVLRRPASTTRRTPFAIPHPVNLENELIIRTTRPFHLNRVQAVVNCEAFRFKLRNDVRSNSCHYHLQYASNKDHVLPAELKKYIEAVELAQRQVRHGILLASHNQLVGEKRPLVRPARR